MAATMNLLRQTGVLLASKGLVVYWTLRLAAVTSAGPPRGGGAAAPWRRPARAGAAPRSAGITVPSWRTYCVMAGVVVRIFSCSLASFSTRSGVACARFSTCSRSRVEFEPAASLLQRGELGEELARRYCVCTRKMRRGQHGDQQEEVQARHGIRPRVRSATRRMALRARGLAATSACDGLDARQRRAASSPAARRRARGGRRPRLRMLRDELLDDAVFQRMEADHRQPAAAAAAPSGSPLAPVAALQARR